MESTAIQRVTTPTGDPAWLVTRRMAKMRPRVGEIITELLDAMARQPQPGTSNPHMTFGHGPRFCVGAPLARIELQMLFPALLNQFPTLRLAVPIESLRGRDELLTGGLVELPLTW